MKTQTRIRFKSEGKRMIKGVDTVPCYYVFGSGCGSWAGWLQQAASQSTLGFVESTTVKQGCPPAWHTSVVQYSTVRYSVQCSTWYTLSPHRLYDIGPLVQYCTGPYCYSTVLYCSSTVCAYKVSRVRAYHTRTCFCCGNGCHVSKNSFLLAFRYEGALFQLENFQHQPSLPLATN